MKQNSANRGRFSRSAPVHFSNLLIQASKLLRELGHEQSELLLIKKAVELDRTEHKINRLFWAACRAREFEVAETCVAERESPLGSEPSETDRIWLEKARSTLRKRQISVAEVVKRLKQCHSLPFEPVTGRICYVLSDSLPYSSSGYATRSHGMSAGLQNLGYEVICVSRPGFPIDRICDETLGNIPREDVIDGIRYRRILKPSRRTAEGREYIDHAARALADEFIALRPQIVMAASNFANAIPAQFAANTLGLPFIYEVRGFWEITRISREPEFESTREYRELVALESTSASYADHVFTLTEPMREELIARGVSSPNISLLPNSCDPQLFTPRSRDPVLAERMGIPRSVPVIGYIGKFAQYEGLEDLAEACALLRRRGAQFRLLLVGNENAYGNDRGPIMQAIQRIASEGELADWLIMPGRIPHEEVEAYYSLIDIAPIPRKPQPVSEMVSPLKPLEALAMQKAVLVSSVQALAELIHDGETGLVFEKGNLDCLASKLALLVADPVMRLRLGQAGRAWVLQERTWLRTASFAAEILAKMSVKPEAPARERHPN